MSRRLIKPLADHALLEAAAPLLRCPHSRAALAWNPARGAFMAQEPGPGYLLSGALVDFLARNAGGDAGAGDASAVNGAGIVAAAFDRFSGSYDHLLTGRNIFVRMAIRFIWGMEHHTYAAELMALLPRDFSGVLLDAPAGTGVFTWQAYRDMPGAVILALDHSRRMLAQAEERFAVQGVRNALCLRADAADLPLHDASVDVVLCMNGLHSFPHKTKTLAEFNRVLKPGGQLLGSLYVRGRRMLSDILVRRVFARKNLFSPPLLTAAEFESLLAAQGFRLTLLKGFKSFMVFAARSQEAGPERITPDSSPAAA